MLFNTDWLTTLVSLTAAALFGGCVGLEREFKRHWAGLRTHMLVALAAAIFVRAGLTVAEATASDLTRVIQGIAAGVGFIGAGTILKLTDRVEVKGLTTASTIWMAAAVGTACGVELYAMAAIGAALALSILVLLAYVETWIGNRTKKGDEITRRDVDPPSTAE